MLPCGVSASFNVSSFLSAMCSSSCEWTCICLSLFDRCCILAFPIAKLTFLVYVLGTLRISWVIVILLPCKWDLVSVVRFTGEHVSNVFKRKEVRASQRRIHFHQALRVLATHLLIDRQSVWQCFKPSQRPTSFALGTMCVALFRLARFSWNQSGPKTQWRYEKQVGKTSSAKVINNIREHTGFRSVRPLERPAFSGALTRPSIVGSIVMKA